MSSKERGTAAFPSRLNPAPWNAGQGVSGGGAGGRPAGLQLDGSAALQAVGGLQAGLRPGLLWVGAQAWWVWCVDGGVMGACGSCSIHG